MEPLVSICIPAYKPEFLAEAIESAINQTYRNIEIIIVNDCSPYDLTSIVEKFSDDRIRYFINEKNLGGYDPGVNWNKCLSLAKGEFISILCDDDAYYPEFIETLVELAGRYPKCGVLRTGGKWVDEKGEVKFYYPSCPEWQSSAEYLWELSSEYKIQSISEFIFNRKLLLERKGFSPLPKAWGSDKMAVVVMGQEGGIVTSPMRLILHRVTHFSITGNLGSNIEEKLLACHIYSKWAQDFADKQDDEIKALLTKSISSNAIKECRVDLAQLPLRSLVNLFIHKRKDFPLVSKRMYRHFIVERIKDFLKFKY